MIRGSPACLAIALAIFTAPALHAQSAAAPAPPAANDDDGFFHDWFEMVSETQAEQPHWITLLNTTPPRLEQEFRYDIQWQTHNSGVTTDNYGVSEGLEIILAKNFEAILAVPPYIVNNPDSPNNGFGDWQFLVYLATAD
jgi:hypothetical protein